jgi:hypothetical protein
MMRIFSSLTKNGLYFIFRFEEGRTNSYVGVAILGKGIMFFKLQYFYLYRFFEILTDQKITRIFFARFLELKVEFGISK